MLRNMMLTNLTPLTIKTEENSWENQPFMTVWPEQLQQTTKEVARTVKKKQRRERTAFTTEQLLTLERTYSRFKYIDAAKRYELAKSLNVGDKIIKVWFQNRRMKDKRASSESSCDSSSECFGENETHSNSVPPPFQAIPEPNTQDFNQYYNSGHSDYSYQVPPTYNVHQDMNEVPTPYIFSFLNDDNIYPTQHYPVNMDNSGIENIGNNNHYDTELNQYGTPNNSSYFAQI